MIALVLTAQAYFLGNDFVALCQKDRASCTHYIMGVLDGTNALIDALDKKSPICIPASTTASQMTDVSLQYFKKNPDKVQYTAASSIVVALIDAYPCSKT